MFTLIIGIVNMKSAVLFLVFNRPDTTQQVFDAIREAKPPRLYIAADGPRLDKEDELIKCNEVRRILTLIDWPCEVFTLFREENLGCKYAVSKAITWFFDHEEEGIILEDDTLPSPLFFEYCDGLLEKYRNNTKVMSISGSYFGEIAHTNAEYYYSIYPLMWGWATWRNCWQFYTLEVDDFSPILKRMSRSYLWRKYWTEAFEHVSDLSNKKINTWDYQWILTVWRNEGLVCRPKVNLVKNIGFDNRATHTIHENPIISNLKFGNLNIDFTQTPSSLFYALEDKIDEEVWLNFNWKLLIALSFPLLFQFYGKLKVLLLRRY